MKKSIVCVFAGVLALFILPVAAHAPSEMTLEYDLDSQVLTVTIVHNVSDPASHYIFNIEIQVNTTETYEYTNQPTESEFSYTYNVPASQGDTIMVIAECNLGGSMTQSLVVGPSTTKAEVPVPDLYPVHAGLMSVGLIFMLVTVSNVLTKSPKAWWLKAHKITGAVGSICIVLGLFIAGYMVSQTGGPHLRVLHGYLGLLTVILTVVTPFIGLKALTWRKKWPKLRLVHIWISRITLVLIIVTIISGMWQAGLF
ncbi:MAG: hypothetical protein PVF58_21080 [Candidatus Methanofastidiosia archaeon]|jgi:hypothetical protein